MNIVKSVLSILILLTLPFTATAGIVLPGGESAIPGSPYYVNLLEPWLRNESFPLQDPSTGVLSTQLYLP